VRIGHKHPPVDAAAGIRTRGNGIRSAGAQSRRGTPEEQETGSVTGKGTRTGLEKGKGPEPGRGKKTETDDGAGNAATTGGRQGVSLATAETARAAAPEVVAVPAAVQAATNGSVFVLRARATAVVDVPEGRRHRGQATNG